MSNGKSTSDSIVRRIRGHGRGWIFTTSEFLDLGAESALKKTLSRLCHDGMIRRLTRGIYDYPRTHTKLGILSPNPDDVAAALAASTGSRVQISGGRAANLFGLTTQVPAQLVYLTDGPPRRVKIEGQTIQLRHARPSKFPGTGTPAGLAIQAMRAVGPEIDKDLIFRQLSRGLSASDKSQLIKLRKHAPRWTQEIIRQLEATIDGQMGKRTAKGQRNTLHRNGSEKGHLA
ncbi:MAG TPA: DUF6088 family protein [Candidatus Dormibacteraeota bacterium]|nr:DUF6088 family protein [Candidatus Dormibacteraeota bacterium]